MVTDILVNINVILQYYCTIVTDCKKIPSDEPSDIHAFLKVCVVNWQVRVLRSWVWIWRCIWGGSIKSVCRKEGVIQKEVSVRGDHHQRGDTSENEASHTLIAGVDNLSTADLIPQVLDYFLSHKQANTSPWPVVSPFTATPASSYTTVTEEDVDQPIFMTALSSVDGLTTLALNRGRQCPEVSSTPEVKGERGHTAMYVSGSSCKSSLPSWSFSLYLPNQKFLVNYRVAHGYLSSDLLYSEYVRSVDWKWHSSNRWWGQTTVKTWKYTCLWAIIYVYSRYRAFKRTFRENISVIIFCTQNHFATDMLTTWRVCCYR